MNEPNPESVPEAARETGTAGGTDTPSEVSQPEKVKTSKVKGSGKKVHFKRTRRILGKIPFPPKTRKGVITLVFVSGLLATFVAVAGFMMVSFTETTAFCSICHTMEPEQKAHDLSPHSKVTCAECHVAPGVGGWVKAKVNGTKQLLDVITGKYPTPIPPPAHSELPDVKDTCLECHSITSINSVGGPIKLVLRPHYLTDKTNTKETVAVVLRPNGLQGDVSAPDTTSGTSPKGVHWHVATEVNYLATDDSEQTIPLVQFTDETGNKITYIAAKQIGLANNVTPDINRLNASLPTLTVTCLTCHNRVGHDIPNTSTAVDGALATGKISTSLPYIKSESVKVLDKVYSTETEAFAAIDALGISYDTKYPALVKESPQMVPSMVDTLKVIYHSIATPGMKVDSKTYPDNLGHQSSLGCFRCHDGAHVKVVNGKASNEVIPSTCNTCHTFPQTGSNVSGLSLGSAPKSHSDTFWVFNHKNSVSSVNAAFATNGLSVANCSSCHQKSYCENCHNSGAVNVTHDEMLYSHATAAKKSGGQACAYCHQPVYCATCHAGNNVLATPALKPVPLARATKQS